MTVSQISAPLFMLMAMTCASSVVLNSRSPSTPYPRLTSPQQAIEIARQFTAVAPQLAAGPRIERPAGVEGASDVNNAVHHERRRLELSQRLGLEDPLRREAVDVLRRDVLERAVALIGVVTRVGEPARRVLQAVAQILGRDLRGRDLLRGDRPRGRGHDHRRQL
jgi:hypothetical protein